ncbi:TPA: hypothetical protein ACX6S1_002345 [Photobacterium damselae]
MARNPRVQLSLTEKQHSRIETYQRKNEFSSLTDAAKDLIEFALTIKERAADSSLKTTREIMEEILATQYQQEKLTKQMYMATFNPDLRVAKENVAIVNAKFHQFDEESRERSSVFIRGNNK